MKEINAEEEEEVDDFIIILYCAGVYLGKSFPDHSGRSPTLLRAY